MYKIKAKLDFKDLFKGQVYTASKIYVNNDIEYYVVDMGNKNVLYCTKHFTLLEATDE